MNTTHHFGPIITHHFGPINDVLGVPVGLYIKETKFRAGESIPMHTHVHSHMSVLASGWVLLTVDGEHQELRAPKVISIERGHDHKVVALTDATWLCCHATDERDPEKIDERLTT